ncbi:MAG: T9SS type A sorting domain-containing protein [Chitinophagaceae bacterium]|nr:T9SS type A sorting domain-containing protein [Chitinophagaceae bacterium]
MKKIYTTLCLLAIAAMSFSQTFYVYTAQNSGYWYNSGNWNIQLRTDGITKHKVLIPATFTIIVDNNVNSMGLGDVEVFVSGNFSLQSNTTLTLSNNSSIQLNNGFISGSAANQQILIGSTVKYKGDIDGNKTGYSLADNTTGSSPFGFRSFSLLPVNFTSFYISKTNQNIQLSWSTDKEIMSSHFDVERSFNGTQWEKISVIFSAGTSNNTNNYTYSDKNISNPVVYYRLRQVDLNGRSVYSSIKMIRMSETISTLKIYGFEKNVVIDLNTSVKSKIIVTVVSTNGQVINEQVYNNPSYKINLNLQNVASGAYFVRVTDNKGWLEVKKVIL